MKRGLLGFLVIVLACVASPARADSIYGSTSGVDGVLYDDCVAQPFHWSVTAPAATYQALRVSLLAPDGALLVSDFYIPLDTSPASGSSTFHLCRPANLYGTYTIRARFESGDDPQTAQSHQLDDSHFTMRKPFTRTTLSVSTRGPAYGQVVAYRIRALDERPTGYVGTSAAWVLLQKKVDGHWVRIKGSRAMTHSTGYIKVRLRYPYHHKTMRIRAVTQPTSRYARSTSPVVRLW